jgi:tetratricopeptide (TPR) repeat protein
MVCFSTNGGSGKPMRNYRNHLFCLIITLLTLLAYSNSFENAFQYDDTHVIERNPFIKDPSRIAQFFVNPHLGSGLASETSSYRPLLMASLSINHFLGGLNVFGYHLFNFFVHLLCTLLVYAIILYIFRFTNLSTEANSLRGQLIALFASLVFGLHPVQTESVTYITGRSSSLIALFFLASFFAYMQYRFTQSIRYLVFSSLSFACSLLVKETAITLLAVVVLFDFMFLHGRTLRNRFLSLLPHFSLSILYLIFRVYLFGSLQYGTKPIRPFYEQMLSQSRAWVHYLGTLLLPLNLNIDYDFPVSHSILEYGVMLGILILAALSWIIWRFSRSNRLIGFFALWFTITLLPTNSVIALDDLVTDRWLYLSSVGYAVLLALTADWFFNRRVQPRGRAGKIVFFSLCALVIELYGFSTLLRNFDWMSQRTLWEDTVSKSPNKARPYNALGLALALQNRLEEATQTLRHAIELDPRAGQPYLNMGYVYSLQENLDKAIECYEKVIPLSPRLLPEIYNNLGLTYLKKGKLEESEKYLRMAIELRPHNAAAHCNLGLYYEKKGDIAQAISSQEKANKLDPDNYLPYEALSRLYKMNGWEEKSQAAYRDFQKYWKKG